MKVYEHSGIVMNCDNFYTSPAAFIRLREMGIYARGTCRSDRRMFPTCVTYTKPEAKRYGRGKMRVATNGGNVVCLSWCYLCWQLCVRHTTLVFSSFLEDVKETSIHPPLFSHRFACHATPLFQTWTISPFEKCALGPSSFCRKTNDRKRMARTKQT